MKVTIMRTTFLPRPFYETTLLTAFRSLSCSSKHTLFEEPAPAVRFLHSLNSFRPLPADDNVIDE